MFFVGKKILDEHTKSTFFHSRQHKLDEAARLKFDSSQMTEDC